MPGPRTRPVHLSGLRGFEAAARRLSFTLAAQELGLTQSAVSRQVQGLEAQVGRKLFRRGVRSLALTEAGRRMYGAVHAALAEIDRGVDEVRGVRRRRRLAVTTAASLSSLVLVPRLPDFSRLHPEVDLRIDAADGLRDLRADGIDLAIRYFRHERAPRALRLLLDERLVPVISPRLLERIGPLRRPADLARTTLIDEDPPTPADERHWDRWFASTGGVAPDTPRLGLSYSHQALDAALRGQGVMLAPTMYVREHLERGTLVAPLGPPRPSGFGFYLVVDPESARLKHVDAFVGWVTGLFDELSAAP